MNKHGAYNPLAAYEEFDSLTLSVVKDLGWYNMCSTSNADTVRANFRMAYEERAEALRKERLLPDFVVQKKLALQKQYISIEDKPIEQIQEDNSDRSCVTPEQMAEFIEKMKGAVGIGISTSRKV